MDKLKVAPDPARKQAGLGTGLVALLTAGGEQIFSSAVFRCPCSDLNLLYGLVFLLVPALVLLLLGFILSHKTWRLLTGACPRSAPLCRGRGARTRWRRLIAGGSALLHISIAALVAPCSWIAVALLNGNYYECAMTGTNESAYAGHLCGEESSRVLCLQQLHRFPCGTGSDVPRDDRENVLLRLRAHSQILGWLLIASVMLSHLLLTCVARCSSPISHLQLSFWRTYVQEERCLMDSYSAEHARELAKRNTKSFFGQTPPEDLITPSCRDWEKISSLYKFSTKDHYYSTLHRYVERCQETDAGVMRMASVVSSEHADATPAVLGFVDEGRAAL